MAQQRQRAKEDAAGKKTGNADISVLASLLERSGRVTFTGYDDVADDATVTGLLVGGVSVPAAGPGGPGDPVLDPAPVYAEGGRPLAHARPVTASGTGA